MSVERKDRPWVTITEVKRLLRVSKSLNKSQVSGVLDELDKLAFARGFPWNEFLKNLENSTEDVGSPSRISKTKSLKRRSIDMQQKVDLLVDTYLDVGGDDHQEDKIPAPEKMASIVNVTMESISGLTYLDLDPLQKSILLDNLKKYGFDLLSLDLIKSPKHSAEEI